MKAANGKHQGKTVKLKKEHKTMKLNSKIEPIYLLVESKAVLLEILNNAFL